MERVRTRPSDLLARQKPFSLASLWRIVSLHCIPQQPCRGTALSTAATANHRLATRLPHKPMALAPAQMPLLPCKLARHIRTSHQPTNRPPATVLGQSRASAALSTTHLLLGTPGHAVPPHTRPVLSVSLFRETACSA